MTRNVHKLLNTDIQIMLLSQFLTNTEVLHPMKLDVVVNIFI